MRLLFVYNADDGLFNAVTDTLHKVLAPQTYACGLCYYTHGTFGMLKPWRDFVLALPVDVEFLHRNEFVRAYGHDRAALPAVLWEDERGEIATVVSAADLSLGSRREVGMAALMDRVGAFAADKVPAPSA